MTAKELRGRARETRETANRTHKKAREYFVEGCTVLGGWCLDAAKMLDAEADRYEREAELADEKDAAEKQPWWRSLIIPSIFGGR